MIEFIMIAAVLWVLVEVLAKARNRKQDRERARDGYFESLAAMDSGIDLEDAIRESTRNSTEVLALVENYFLSIMVLVNQIDRTERCIRLGINVPPTSGRVHFRLVPRLRKLLESLPDVLIVRVLRFEAAHLRHKVKDLREENCIEPAETLLDRIHDNVEDMCMVINNTPLLADEIDRLRLQLAELRSELDVLVAELTDWEKRFALDDSASRSALE